MGFVLIAGECGAAQQFGNIFPACGFLNVCGKAEVNASDCAVILGQDNPHISIINAAGVIFNADMPPEMLPDGIQLISCGIGAKNTVSLSSRTAESVTLSLNRSIHTQNGICEPLELPVPADESANIYDYMAAFAASALLGNL